ncbi:MAG: hypothetical protein QXJ48_06575 [Candidatus Korarchaeum sp.]
MVKRGNDYYLNGLGKAVRTAEPNGKTMATDIDENNLTFGSKERMVKKTTMERPIRTAYFSNGDGFDLNPDRMKSH